MIVPLLPCLQPMFQPKVAMVALDPSKARLLLRAVLHFVSGHALAYPLDRKSIIAPPEAKYAMRVPPLTSQEVGCTDSYTVLIQVERGLFCFSADREIDGVWPPDLLAAVLQLADRSISSGHCSPVRARIWSDSTLLLTSHFMDANQEVLTPATSLGAGLHRVEVEAEGRIGGCNTEGRVETWGGEIFAEKCEPGTMN